MKMNSKKIIAFVVLIVTIAYTVLISGQLGWYIDIPSLLILVVLSMSIMVMSGTVKDYFRGFSIITGNTKCTTKELKATESAVLLSIKSLIVSCIIMSIIGFVSGYRFINSSNIGAMFAVMLLSVLYALIFNLINYAILHNIKKELIYREK
jgi:hypothetical protein